LSAPPPALLPPLERHREEPRPVFELVVVLRLAAGFDAVERDALPVDLARDAVPPVVLRVPLLFAELVLRAVEPERAPPEVERDDPELSSSPVHLPDMTRCAASATASAISEPSFVALDIMLLAALLALSAASMPASRMARRALGLAAIAAAAAVRPAASISLLMAALVILSIVESLDRDDPDVDADELVPDVPPERFASERCLVVLRFAISISSLGWGKDTSGPKRFRRAVFLRT
jgi:hypothetical protein